MVWIESHQSLGAHPKTKKLARLLDVSIPTAVGHLHCLWWWAMDYAQDGCLARYDDLDIAVGAMWEGEPAAFRQALHAAGFLDPDEAIHDWDDYAGKLIARREANAERMRNARAGTKEDRAAHVQRTQRARAALPDQPTRPTKPTAPPKPPPSPIKAMNGAPPASLPSSGPTYSKLLGKTVTKVVGSFRLLDVGLTETWLKNVLIEVERDVGPLPRDKLQEGLHIAYSGLERAIEAERGGGRRIANIRGLSRKIILDSLKEQADVHVA